MQSHSCHSASLSRLGFRLGLSGIAEIDQHLLNLLMQPDQHSHSGFITKASDGCRYMNDSLHTALSVSVAQVEVGDH